MKGQLLYIGTWNLRIGIASFCFSGEDHLRSLPDTKHGRFPLMFSSQLIPWYYLWKNLLIHTTFLYLITICHRYQTTNLKNKNICFTFRLSKGHISLLPKSFELKPCCNVNSEGLVARHFIESALSIAKVTPGCINKRTSTCLAWTMIVYF